MPARILFLCLLSLSLHAQPPAAEMFTRTYEIGYRPYFFGDARMDFDGTDPFGGVTTNRPATSASNSPWRPTETPERIRAYLAEHSDITFPEGSWIRYNSLLQALTMHNTAENHRNLHATLRSSGVLYTQVKISLNVLRMEKTEFERIEREAGPGSVGTRELLAAWKNGKATCQSAQSVTTINGVNAIIECVDEVIYPTEQSTDTNAPNTVVYGGLETRNTGLILNVTPTVSASQSIINLVILPEASELLGTYEHTTPALAPMTPTFRSLNLCTSVALRNGQSLLTAHTSSRDGTGQLFLLLTATLLDETGQPIGPDEPER